MKASLLIKSIDERTILRPWLSAFDEIEFHSKTEDLTASLFDKPPAQLYVLDERAGNLTEVLGHIAAFAMREKQAPVILVIIQERPKDEMLRAAECDRIDAYGELGVEQFIYRPFSLNELEASVRTCESWARNLPPWVQLMRAGRHMFRHKKHETIVHGLEKLHQLMPDQTSTGLLLARCLMDAGDATSLTKAAAVLEKLKERNPTSLVVGNLLAESLLRQGKHVPAARALLDLITERWSDELYCATFDAARKVYESTQDAQVLHELLAKVRKHEPLRTKEARLELLQAIAGATTNAESVERFVAELKNEADLRMHLVAEIAQKAELIGAIPPEGQESNPTPPSASGMLLLEWILDGDASHAKALNACVRAYLRSGNLRDAETRLNAARYTRRHTLEYFICMGLVSVERKRLDSAMEHLNAAERFPNSPQKTALIAPLREATQKAARAA